MSRFTIKDIENLCGIKAHTLRMWEQRHNLCLAHRKESHHRVYDNEAVKKILWISYLYHNGYKISQIAKLSTEEIFQLVQHACAATQKSNEGYISKLITAGLELDKDKFEKTINCLLLQIGFDRCIIDIFYPFLQRMNLLWMTNHALKAQQRFVSHIIRKTIILATEGLEVTSKENNIIIFSPEGEHDEIPLLAAAYFLRKNGIYTTYFGANVSDEAITYYAEAKAVNGIFLHIVTNIYHCKLKDKIHSLCSQFAALPVFISGMPLKCVGEKPGNLHIVETPDMLPELVKSNATVHPAI